MAAIRERRAMGGRLDLDLPWEPRARRRTESGPRAQRQKPELAQQRQKSGVPRLRSRRTLRTPCLIRYGGGLERKRLLSGAV